MDIKYTRIISAAMAFSLFVSCQSCGNTVNRSENSSGTVTEDGQQAGADAEAEEALARPDGSGDSEISDETEPTSTEPAVTTTTVTTTVTTTTTLPAVMKGNIYDADGDLLMYSYRDEDGIEVRAFNQDYKVSFANVLSEMSEGYDTIFEEQLRTPNPSPVDGERKVGQSIQLTYDADVQNAIYNYMDSMNIIGSVVVLRADGSIMSQVSYPSYNPDYFYGTDYEEDLAWGTYGNKAFQNAEPGSTFKMMSEVIADKHGIYSLWDEGTWYDDGATIVNWDHERNAASYPMERSLYSAFVNSSNIFFAKVFNEVGESAVLEDLDSIFHFVTPIECDFGTLHNNIEIYCNDDLRRSAFGQSYVLTCPIYLAALCHEAALGDMVTPFALKNVVDTNDFYKVTKNGSDSYNVIASIPEDYRQNLWSGMLGVAGNLGVYVPAGYTLYAKTGTAETWVGDFLYITGCLRTEYGNDVEYGDYSDYNGSYIIVMQVQNPGYFSFDFASESAQLYQGLINIVAG